MTKRLDPEIKAVRAIDRSVAEARGATAVRKLLLTRQEAAASLGFSLRHFERHVQPHVPCVYSGQLRQYRPRDLERWVEDNVTTRDAA